MEDCSDCGRLIQRAIDPDCHGQVFLSLYNSAVRKAPAGVDLNARYEQITLQPSPYCLFVVQALTVLKIAQAGRISQKTVKVTGSKPAPELQILQCNLQQSFIAVN